MGTMMSVRNQDHMGHFQGSLCLLSSGKIGLEETLEKRERERERGRKRPKKKRKKSIYS
jgi:hypothetical protein